VPRRQDKGSARSRQLAAARLSAFLLVVGLGVLGSAQASTAAPAQPDIDYLNAAHQTNVAIVQASQAAKTQGQSSCVQRVGAQLERDHRMLAAQELEAAQQLNIGLVPIPTLEQRQQLNAVAAKAGTSGYDTAWLNFQLQQHQHYLALISTELKNGSDAAIRSVAQGAQSVVQMHLHQVDGTCRVAKDTPTVPTGDGGQMAHAQRLRSQTALVIVGLGVLLLAGKSAGARRRVFGVSALVIGIVLAFGGRPGDTGEVAEGGSSAPEREAAIPPIRLAVPGIVNAPVVPVATGRDGQLQVPKPATTVGWWAAGGAPGSAGGTVLLVGHVDSAREGRGVFAALREVKVGAKVAVTAGDGVVHRYRIVARRTYRQDDLPTDLFRGSSKPKLALVTCTRSFDASKRRYSHNLVLYGVPLAPT
jgi:predicted outer membrane protein